MDGARTRANWVGNFIIEQHMPFNHAPSRCAVARYVDGLCVCVVLYIPALLFLCGRSYYFESPFAGFGFLP